MFEPGPIFNEKSPIQIARENLFTHYAECKPGDPAHFAIATSAISHEYAAIDDNLLSTPQEQTYAQKQIEALSITTKIYHLIIPGFDEAVEELDPFIEKYKAAMGELAIGDKENQTATMLKQLAKDIRLRSQTPPTSLDSAAL